MNKKTLVNGIECIIQNSVLVILNILVAVLGSIYAPPEETSASFTVVVFSVISFLMLIVLNHQLLRSALLRPDLMTQTPRFWGIKSFVLRSLSFGCLIAAIAILFAIVFGILSTSGTVSIDKLKTDPIFAILAPIFIAIVYALLMIRLGNWFTSAVDPEEKTWVFRWERKYLQALLPLLIVLGAAQAGYLLINTVLTNGGFVAGKVVGSILLSLVAVVSKALISVLIAKTYETTVIKAENE